MVTKQCGRFLWDPLRYVFVVDTVISCLISCLAFYAPNSCFKMPNVSVAMQMRTVSKE